MKRNLFIAVILSAVIGIAIASCGKDEFTGPDGQEIVPSDTTSVNNGK